MELLGRRPGVTAPPLSYLATVRLDRRTHEQAVEGGGISESWSWCHTPSANCLMLTFLQWIFWACVAYLAFTFVFADLEPEDWDTEALAEAEAEEWWEFEEGFFG